MLDPQRSGYKTLSTFTGQKCLSTDVQDVAEVSGMPGGGSAACSACVCNVGHTAAAHGAEVAVAYGGCARRERTGNPEPGIQFAARARTLGSIAWRRGRG